MIARSSTEHDCDLGVDRCIVEAALALPHRLRRLRIRWEIRDESTRRFPPSAAPSSAGADCAPRFAPL
jgi:hypothetical protein